MSATTSQSTKRAAADDAGTSNAKRARSDEARRPIYVYYWTSYDEERERSYEKDGETRTTTDRTLVVLVYGVDEEGRTVCVRLAGVRRRLIIEFPDHIDIAGRYRGAVEDGLRDVVYNFADRRSIRVKSFQPLYKPRGPKPMVELTVGSNATASFVASAGLSTEEIKEREKRFGGGGKPRRQLRNSFPFLKPEDKLFVHEAAATAELQVMVRRGVPSVGWVRCGPSAVLASDSARVSRCDVEILCREEDFWPEKNPPPIIPPLTMAAWDIEARVADIAAPGEDPADEIFQISIVTSRGERRLLTLGRLSGEGVPELQDVEITEYADERALLVGFGDQMRALRPNVVTGWNVTGFDWEMLSKRAAHHLCLDYALDFQLSAIHPTELRNKTMCTAATGHKKLTYPVAEGVLAIDMLYMIKDNIKMATYSLEAVGRELLDEGKDDVSLADLTRCYRALVAARDAGAAGREDAEDLMREAEGQLTRVGKYCVQDSALVVRIAEKQKAVLSLLGFSAVVQTPPDLVHTSGQQLRFYNLTYSECYKQGIVVQAGHGGEYSGQGYSGAYVCDPEPGLYKYVVSFDFTSMYPSLIQCHNVDFMTVVDADAATPYPDEDFLFVEWEDHIGCEHDETGAEQAALAEQLAAHRAGAAVLDDDALFLLEKRAEVVNKRLAARRTKRMCASRRFKIYQKRRGVLPTIVENLLSARRETRADMKTTQDPTMLTLLNQRQLAYKVAANSMYGAMGVDEGRLKCKHAAMCVTALGRESIKKAARILTGLGTQQVYGDTDSVYGRFPEFDGVEDRAERARLVWTKATEVARETTGQFQRPMAIEFEDNIYENFLILSKKRYIYSTVSPDGVSSGKLGNRGVLLTRRDYSRFTKRSYEALIRLVFSGGDLEQARQFLAERFLTLFRCQVPVGDVCISKSVNPLIGSGEPSQGGARARGGGSSPDDRYSLYGYTLRKPQAPPGLSDAERRVFFVTQLPPQMQLALRMNGRGAPIPDGNRIEYCVVKRPASSGKTKSALIEDADYIRRNGDAVRVDYLSAMNATRVSHNEVAEVVWRRRDPLACVYDQFERKAAVVEELRRLWAPRLVLKAAKTK